MLSKNYGTWNGYVLGQKLGSGIYSKVRVATKDNQIYAFKYITKTKTNVDNKYK